MRRTLVPLLICIATLQFVSVPAGGQITSKQTHRGPIPVLSTRGTAKVRTPLTDLRNPNTFLTQQGGDPNALRFPCR